MKRILLFFFLISGYLVQAQHLPNKITTPTEYREAIFDSLGIPVDTFHVPSHYNMRARPWIASKGDQIYIWSVSLQKWVLVSGGGGGGSDSSLFATRFWTSGNFQPIGSYLTASDLVPYYTKTQLNSFFGGTASIAGYNKANWDNVYASWAAAQALSPAGWATQRALTDTAAALRAISGGGGGSGDMTKAVYDPGNNGTVDNAENLNGQTPTYYLTQNTGLRGVSLPSLSVSGGFLKYTGTGTNTWVFDANTYLTANQSISFAPTGDVTGSTTGTTSLTPTFTIGSNKVTDAMIRQSAGLSVIGRGANSTGNVADIAAGSDGDVLRRSGTTLGFGSIPQSSVTNLSDSLHALRDSIVSKDTLSIHNQYTARQVASAWIDTIQALRVRTQGLQASLNDSVNHIYLPVGSKTDQSDPAQSKSLVITNKPFTGISDSTDWGYWNARGNNSLMNLERRFTESGNDTAQMQYNGIISSLNRFTLDSLSSRYDATTGWKNATLQYGGAYFVNQFYPSVNAIKLTPGVFGRTGSSYTGTFAIGHSAFNVTLTPSTTTPVPLMVYQSDIDFNRAGASSDQRIITGGEGLAGYVAHWKSHQSGGSYTPSLGTNINKVSDFFSRGSLYIDPFSGTATKSQILASSKVDTSIAFYSWPKYTVTNEVANGFGIYQRGYLDNNYFEGAIKIGGAVPSSTITNLLSADGMGARGINLNNLSGYSWLSTAVPDYAAAASGTAYTNSSVTPTGWDVWSSLKNAGQSPFGHVFTRQARAGIQVVYDSDADGVGDRTTTLDINNDNVRLIASGTSTTLNVTTSAFPTGTSSMQFLVRDSASTQLRTVPGYSLGFGSGSSTPGGSNGSIQYNNSGALGGFGNWDGSTMTVAGSGTFAPSATVPYALTVTGTAGGGSIASFGNSFGNGVFGFDASGYYLQPATSGKGVWLYNASGSSYFGASGAGGLDFHGAIRKYSYGTGANTGTLTYLSGYDASGNEIEVSPASVGGATTNPLTFSNGGAGAASGATFDGSAARTISYNSIGAAHTVRVNSTTYTADASGLVDLGTLAAGGWNGGTNGTSYSATNATIDGNSLIWTFTGSSPATFTLPSYSTFGNRVVLIKNIGSADLTITRAGTDQIYTTSAVTSFTLSAGNSVAITAAANGLTNTWETLFDPTTGASNLALGTATTTTQPITNSNGTGFTLPVFGTNAGLVPGTTSGTTNFLRADGTWAVPSGASPTLQNVTDNGSATTNSITSAGVSSNGDVLVNNGNRVILQDATNSNLVDLQQYTNGVSIRQAGDNSKVARLDLSSITAVRTYTWPNKSGTVAMTSDITGGSGADALGTYIVQTSTNAPANAQVLASLGTGILKNTTTTGVLSIAAAGDFPTLNQSTTGSAASLTTTRTIWGQNFNGTANVSGDLGATGSRVTKVWATDGEFTNMPTINGTSLSSTASTLSNKIIDFGSNTITATSAQLRTALSDENGTGAALFNGATTPDFTTGITVGGAAASGNILQGNGTNYVPTANNGGWTTVRVSGSDATTTGQSLVDITGLASGTLTNSTKYEIEAVLDVSTSAVTTGTEYGIGAGGTGGAAVVSVILTGTSTGTSATSEGLSTTAGTASTARLLTSGQSGTIMLKGFVTTRGSGTATISIQHLKVTSGTSTVKVGSVFRYRLAQ
jgi:trimeric autotransporter adhesin